MVKKLSFNNWVVKEYENINTDMNSRWENGIGHRPESIKLMRHLEALDFTYGGDRFCFKIGGDGDNGEHLMYLLDMFFDLHGNKEIKANNE